MTYTVISLALVGVIVVFWFHNLLRNCFCRSFCILKNRKNNNITQKEASILSVKTIKDKDKPLLELLLLFQNFSGYHIHRKIRVWDSKPQLQRFKPDNTLMVGLNDARKPKDPVFLSQGVCRFSFAFVLLCVVKIVFFIAASYFFIGGAIEKIVAAPEHFELAFKNSMFWQFGTLMLAICVFLYFLLEKIGLLVNGKTKQENWDLLYHGIGAKAVVNTYKDTGTLINDNPVVEFMYSFKDDHGNTFEGSDKQVIGKLEVGSLSDIEKMEIMYLADNPEVSRLIENLDDHNFGRFVQILFMGTTFIFSLIILFMFYNTMLHS
ncbi:hypothetical protein [Flagellimonas sp. GZD32]|uniref:hypothetical protein n=1 Tax=Flagellimonas cixiensis TaxID=3228750 RepID=UPI0035C8FF5B